MLFLAYGIFFFNKIDHLLGNNASLNKYREIEITFWILSNN